MAQSFFYSYLDIFGSSFLSLFFIDYICIKMRLHKAFLILLFNLSLHIYKQVYVDYVLCMYIGVHQLIENLKSIQSEFSSQLKGIPPICRPLCSAAHGNLSWGIVIYSCATRSVVQVHYKALDNNFSNNCPLYHLKG